MVLSPLICLMIEVKNMSHIDLEERTNVNDSGTEVMNEIDRDINSKVRFQRYDFRKSLKQREKVESLIYCIDQDTAVLQFTAYPNLVNYLRDGSRRTQILG